LAEKIKLDDDEYHLWAKVKGGGEVTDPPTPGTWYTVPNKVVVDLGPRQPGLYGWWKDSWCITKMHQRANAKADAYRAKKFKVETHDWSGKTPPGAVDPIQEHLSDPDLHAYGYGGHGVAPGILIYAYGAGKKYAITAGRYSHHRLAEVWLYACYSLAPTGATHGAYDPKTTGGRTGVSFSDWELNVSRYGELTGFEGKAYSSTTPSTRPGGLRKDPPRPPEKPHKPYSERM